MCTYGTAPSVLNVTSQSTVLMGNKPVATIADCAPNTNLPPFALCISLQNPAVQAATQLHWEFDTTALYAGSGGYMEAVSDDDTGRR